MATLNETDNTDDSAQKVEPPYASPGHADKLFDLFRRVTPQKIDAKFISDNGITTPTNASVVIRLARWFGFIDQNGNVVSSRITKMKLAGEERNKYIAGLIKEAYKDLFEHVDLNNANKDDVTNYFVHTYEYGSRQAEFASALFLHLCQTYGVPISDSLKKKVYAQREKTEVTSRIKNVGGRPRKSELNADEPERPSSREGAGIEIIVKSFGLESDPHTSIIARSTTELEDKLKENGEFDAFIKYVKILLKQKDVGKKSLFDEFGGNFGFGDSSKGDKKQT